MSGITSQSPAAQGQPTRTGEWMIAHLREFMVAGFVLMAFAYAFTSPIFEKNDESHHFAFARHLVMGSALPVQQAGVQTPWRQSGSQPPLYYAMASLLIRFFDTGDFPAQLQPNQSPQFSPHATGNRNVLLITPEKRAFAYRDTTLAAFFLRLASIITGVVTLWMTWAIAMLLTHRATLAAVSAIFAAFIPMFVTVVTAVSNDGLVIALSSVALWMMTRWMVQGATLQQVLFTGIVIGFASIAKVNGLVLIPIATLAALLDTRASRNLRHLLAQWVCLLAPVLLIAGWWYARNLMLYGDLAGTAAMAAVAGVRQAGLVNIIDEFQGFRMSYLGIFGHFNVPAPNAVYVLWDAFLVICAAGLILRTALRWKALSYRYKAAYVLIVTHIALTFAALARWTMMTTGSEGRLLFPCIAGIALLMALGLDMWRVLIAQTQFRTLSPAVILAPVVSLMAFALVVPFGIVRPAYTPPYVSSIPAGYIPIQQTLHPWAEVLAYKMEPDQTRPGGKVRISVIMRALRVPVSNHSLVVNLYGRNAVPLARFDTFTGSGLLPSSQWRPRDMWRDIVELSVPNDATAPAVLRVQFNLYNAGSGEIARSIDANGNDGAPLYAGSTLLPSPADTVTSTEATFGELIALESHGMSEARPGQPMTITLKWHSMKPAQSDYTAFIHIVDNAGKLVAQNDSPLLNGEYPSTHWGDAFFTEVRQIALPAGLSAAEYRVLIGFYDSQTGARLEAIDTTGNRIANDMLLLGFINAQ